MPGAIPRKGLVRAASYNYKQYIGVCRVWGYAEYDRELTEKEISDYELEPGKHNPLDYGEDE